MSHRHDGGQIYLIISMKSYCHMSFWEHATAWPQKYISETCGGPVVLSFTTVFNQCSGIVAQRGTGTLHTENTIRAALTWVKAIFSTLIMCLKVDVRHVSSDGLCNPETICNSACSLTVYFPCIR